MERAKVTLIGPLSLAVGRYRFKKDKEVIVEDPSLLEYCKIHPDFKVEMLAEVTKKIEPKVNSQPSPVKTESVSSPVKKLTAQRGRPRIKQDGEGAA